MVLGAGSIHEHAGSPFPINPAGGELQTHRGVLKHDDLIGKPWGSQVFSHQGSPFFLLQPSLADILTELPRNTQIMYPKDIGFILFDKIPNYSLPFVIRGFFDLSQHPPIVEAQQQ